MNTEDSLDKYLVVKKIAKKDAVYDLLNQDYYCFGVCLKGSISLKTGIDTLDIDKNQLFCLTPNSFRSWSNPSRKCLLHVIYFKANFFDETLIPAAQVKNSGILSPFSPATVGTDKKTLKQIKYFFASLEDLLALENLDIIRAQLHLIHSYFSFLINPSTENTETRPLEITKEFKSLVRQHYKQKHLVSDYALMLEITPKHLSQMVKDTTGITAGEVIEKIRFEEAKLMLKSENASIREVAESLNFSDQSSFGKFFKRHHGSSPLQYKKSIADK